MGEETNAYDPAGSQFDDDVTAERPTDRAAQSGQKAQATARAAEPIKPLISMSDRRIYATRSIPTRRWTIPTI